MQPQSQIRRQCLDYVSRETFTRLESYVQLLGKWNLRINLVSRHDIDNIWERHILDSLQLLPLLPEGTQSLVDLGSGAGFPGLILAIADSSLLVSLIESDRRKCSFLSGISRSICPNASVVNNRIESVGPEVIADVVTARALASLPILLSWSAPLLKPHGCCLFLKGKNVDAELISAHKGWMMTVKRRPSKTCSDSVVLMISDIAPRYQLKLEGR